MLNSNRHLHCKMVKWESNLVRLANRWSGQRKKESRRVMMENNWETSQCKWATSANIWLTTESSLATRANSLETTGSNSEKRVSSACYPDVEARTKSTPDWLENIEGSLVSIAG